MGTTTGKGRNGGWMVSASELNTFSFCEHAWFLRHIVGLRPGRRDRFAAGRAGHRAHAQRVFSSRKLLRTLTVVAVVCLVVLAVVWTMGGR
jgi:hypothetical protein